MLEREEREGISVEKTKPKAALCIYKKAQTGGEGEGLKRKRYILRNGILLTAILPFKTKNFRLCPFDFFFKNVTFFGTKDFFLLKRRAMLQFF